MFKDNYLGIANSDTNLILDRMEYTTMTKVNIHQNVSPKSLKKKKHFKWSKEEKKLNKKKISLIPYAITSSNWKKVQKEKENHKVAKVNVILEKF